MDLIRISVLKDILSSQFGLAISHDTAKSFLEYNIIPNKNKSIYIFDFRDVVFDHYFARSFGPLFKEISRKDSIIDALFQVKNFQVDDFLLGIIDFLEIPFSIERNGNIQDFFVNTNLSIKFLIKEGQISYLTKLSEESQKVLSFINERNETVFDEIYTQGILCSGEEIYPVLDELIKLRCIYSDSKKYYSVYKYISENQ